MQDVAKAEQRAKFQTLTAPVDGVVQQLAVIPSRPPEAFLRIASILPWSR